MINGKVDACVGGVGEGGGVGLEDAVGGVETGGGDGIADLAFDEDAATAVPGGVGDVATVEGVAGADEELDVLDVDVTTDVGGGEADAGAGDTEAVPEAVAEVDAGAAEVEVVGWRGADELGALLDVGEAEVSRTLGVGTGRGESNGGQSQQDGREAAGARWEAVDQSYS